MADHPIPSSIPDRLEHAEQLKFEGDHKRALEILETILLEDPQNVAALEEVADNELSIDNTDRAITAAKQAVKLNPQSFTGHYILGFLLSQESQWDEAVEHLQEANKHQSNNAEIIRCLGWALFSSGLQPQGIVTLERALNLEHDNTFILCDLGVAYLQIKKFNKARALFTHALEIDPYNKRALECKEAVERIGKECAKMQRD
jgi:tetratricopeptide (TPR) repeat protein